MDGVIGYNIVLAHIPGRAYGAACFLSRMQTDPSQRLELQFLDSIPLKQFEVDMKANTPNAPMLSRLELSLTEREITSTQITQNLMAQLPANDTLQNIIPNLSEILESASPKETIELFPLARAPEIDSIPSY